MDLPGVARAVLIALFAVTGLYCLARCAVRPSGSPGHEQHGRVADLAQVVSSTAMIAMLVTGYGGEQCLKPVDGFGKAYLPKESE